MQHQTSFSLQADLGRQGLLQIQTPTKEEAVGAAASVKEALYRVGLAPGLPALAWMLSVPIALLLKIQLVQKRIVDVMLGIQ